MKQMLGNGSRRHGRRCPDALAVQQSPRRTGLRRLIGDSCRRADRRIDGWLSATRPAFCLYGGEHSDFRESGAIRVAATELRASHGPLRV